MSEFTAEALQLAQQSLVSTLRKNENACKTLKQKDHPRIAQIHMVEQNIKHFRIMLTLVEHQISNVDLTFITKADWQDLFLVMPSFKSQIEKVIVKFKEGSPQHTLAKRRLDSYDIVLRLIDEFNLLS